VSDKSSLILLRAESVGTGEREEPRTKTLPAAHLNQNYPNPFNPTTTIEVDRGPLGLTNVRLLIYDIRGRLVSELPVPPGEGRTRIVWNGRDLSGMEIPSGVYLYRLEKVDDVRKMLLLR